MVKAKKISIPAMLFMCAVVVGVYSCTSTNQGEKNENALSTGDLIPIELLEPQVDRGSLLMQALKDRKSSRSFSPEKLSLYPEPTVRSMVCQRDPIISDPLLTYKTRWRNPTKATTAVMTVR